MPQSERHALVVGGGTMGVGIITMFPAGGWKVDVVSRSAATRDNLPDACSRALASLGKPADLSALATCATTPEAPWPAIDIVVETVSEDLALRQKLFAEMEALARPETALASNSSSFPINEIGKGLATQDRMMGLHFFMRRTSSRWSRSYARSTPTRVRPNVSARSCPRWASGRSRSERTLASSAIASRAP